MSHCTLDSTLCVPVTLQTSDLFVSLLESLNTDLEPDQHQISLTDTAYNILDVSYLLFVVLQSK